MARGDAMELSALPYTPHEMENAMHPFELPRVHYTVVRVAQQQMGIAGDDSWGAKTQEEYLLDVTARKNLRSGSVASGARVFCLTEAFRCDLRTKNRKRNGQKSRAGA